MNDGDLLLHAIRANPDDDTARLVYADYLQENGDPDRAEYIRLQVNFAREFGADPPRACQCDEQPPPCGWCRQWAQWHAATDGIKARLKELEGVKGKNVRKWLDLPGMMVFVGKRGCGWCDHRNNSSDAYRIYVTFHRGFPHESTCTGWVWTYFGRTICKYSCVRSVVLTSEPVLCTESHSPYGNPIVCLFKGGTTVERHPAHNRRDVIGHLLWHDFPGIKFRYR